LINIIAIVAAIIADIVEKVNLIPDIIALSFYEFVISARIALYRT